MCDRFSRIALGWNDRKCAFIGNLLPDPGAAVGLVGDDGEWFPVPIQKGTHHLAVMQLATADLQPQWPSFFIYSRVNLACAAAA